MFSSKSEELKQAEAALEQYARLRRAKEAAPRDLIQAQSLARDLGSRWRFDCSMASLDAKPEPKRSSSLVAAEQRVADLTGRETVIEKQIAVYTGTLEPVLEAVRKDAGAYACEQLQAAGERLEKLKSAFLLGIGELLGVEAAVGATVSGLDAFRGLGAVAVAPDAAVGARKRVADALTQILASEAARVDQSRRMWPAFDPNAQFEFTHDAAVAGRQFGQGDRVDRTIIGPGLLQRLHAVRRVRMVEDYMAAA